MTRTRRHRAPKHPSCDVWCAVSPGCSDVEIGAGGVVCVKQSCTVCVMCSAMVAPCMVWFVVVMTNHFV